MVGDGCAGPPYASIWIDQLRPQPGPPRRRPRAGRHILAGDRSRFTAGECRWGAVYCRGDKSQEQIQIMTSAIGKAATKATTIVEVNALSKFSSWRTLSTDILLAPPRGSQNAVAGAMP